MNRHPTWWTLCCALILAAVASVHGAVALGRALYLLPDPNCTQVDQDPNYVKFAYDPNQVVGHLIGAVDCYHKIKMNLPGSYCDPENDPVLIALESSPAWISMTSDPLARTFMLAGEPSHVGVDYIVLTLTDIPPDGAPKVTEATILLNVLPRPNSAPVVRVNFPKP